MEDFFFSTWLSIINQKTMYIHTLLGKIPISNNSQANFNFQKSVFLSTENGILFVVQFVEYSVNEAIVVTSISILEFVFLFLPLGNLT